MPNNILHKIKFLCRAIPKVEWSGILLYTVKGSIKNPSSMKLILKDIIPMNKGTQAYTEYSFNEKKRDTSGYEDRMIDYFNDNPHALEEDWKMGHIHSHNSMNVFFSGTDMAELNDNSPSHNFYLSLIVNNWMDFCAKLSFVATVDTKIKHPYFAFDENGDEYELENSEFSVKKEKLYIHDCVIDAPDAEKLKVDKTFASNVEEIIKKADFKPPTPQHKVHTPHASRHIPTVTPKVTGFSNPNIKPKQKATDVVRGFVDDIPFADLENMGFGDEPLSDIEEFTVALLRGTNPADEEVFNVELALEELAAVDVEFTPEDLSKSIMDNYPALFEKYFEDRVNDDDHFVELSEEVINILEDYEGNYPFLSNTIMSLKYMVHKFEENATTV